MRNLEQYPITGQEVIDELNTAIRHDTERGAVGGNTGIVLEGVRQYLLNNPGALAAIVQSLKV
jgi:hypothetical protein